MKTCNKCTKEKQRSEFNVNKNRNDGLQSYCRECASALNKERYVYPRPKKVAQKTRPKKAAKSEPGHYIHSDPLRESIKNQGGQGAVRGSNSPKSPSY